MVDDLPAGRLDGAQYGTAKRGLARTAFTDHAEGLATPDLETHPVDRLGVTCWPAKHRGFTNRKVDPEMRYLEQAVHDETFSLAVSCRKQRMKC